MPVDGTQGCLRAFAQLKQQYSKMKLVLSVGGGGKGSENFAAVARSPPRVETFVRTARALVDEFGLDGIDSKCPSPRRSSTSVIQGILSDHPPTTQSTGNTRPTHNKA